MAGFLGCGRLIMLYQLLALTAGLWLMAAPGVLEYEGPARTIHHVLGPIVATFACVALWEVVRGLRWTNVALGAALMAAPLVQPFATPAAVNSLGAGAVIAIASLVRTRPSARYGGGWRALWSPSDDPPPPARR